jgi:hypothetical protein
LKQSTNLPEKKTKARKILTDMLIRCRGNTPLQECLTIKALDVVKNGDKNDTLKSYKMTKVISKKEKLAAQLVQQLSPQDDKRTKFYDWLIYTRSKFLHDDDQIIRALEKIT